MKKILVSMLFLLPLVGCSASIGTPPAQTSTTYTTPAVSSTTYATPAASSTTVTKTNY